MPIKSARQRVIEYLKEIMPQIGYGDDPVGFLIASHRAMLTDAVNPLEDAHTGAEKPH